MKVQCIMKKLDVIINKVDKNASLMRQGKIGQAGNLAKNETAKLFNI